MSKALEPATSTASFIREKKRLAVHTSITGLWIVPLIAVLVSLLLLVVEHAHLSQALGKLIDSLIYSIIIGLPCAVLLNLVAFRYSARFPRGVVLLYFAVLLGMAVAGCLIGAALIRMLHLIPDGQYWREFQSSLPICIIITLVFGFAATSFETLRHRLQYATLELRTRQMEQERANKLLAEAQLSSLESRIHPHFLFNTLNSISSLIPSDPKRAEETVGKLASLLRFSLNASNNSLVPLAQELKIVRDYLEIESTRFGARLQYQIRVDDNLGSCKLPALALQTLVENSVKHVVARRTEGGAIQISAESQAQLLLLNVRDNGPGFSLATISPDHGLGNLINRLQLLYGDRAAVNVSRDGEDTVVRISLPVES